jgi:hypothetical protein
MIPLFKTYKFASFKKIQNKYAGVYKMCVYNKICRRKFEIHVREIKRQIQYK